MNICVQNRNEFPNVLHQYYYQQFMNEISLFILKNCKHEPIQQVFDLDIFDKKYEINNMKKTLELTSEIQEFLKKNGWTSFLCYGDTCLAIYEKEIPVCVAGQFATQ